jgi:ATP-dependent helicase HepA
MAAEAARLAEQDVLDSIEAVTRDASFFAELEEVDAQPNELREGFEVWAGFGASGQASLQLACKPDATNPKVIHIAPNLSGRRGQTLVPADWLLRWFPGGNEIVGTFFRSTAIRTSEARLLRLGHPFIDAVRGFSEWDDRGRCFAFWRYRPSFRNVDPDWAFRFDFIVEGDPEPAARLFRNVEIDLSALASLQRRLDGLFPPYLRTVWLDASGQVVADANRLSALEAPYDKRAGDTNLRPGRFDAADRNLGMTNWAEVCRTSRARSEGALRATPEFLSTVEDRHAAAKRVLAARVEALRARSERAHATRSEMADAEREDELARSLLAGIRSPRVRLEAIGFVCLAGVPLRAEDFDD